MSNSLREKLMGLGFKAPEPERKPERAERAPGGGKSGEAREPRSDRGPRPPGSPRRDGRPSGKPGEARRDGRPGKPGEPRRDGRPAPAGKPGEPRRDGRPPHAGKPGEARAPGARRPARPRSQEEMDLAKAYAIRAQKEKEERIEAERLRQEEARVRREAKARLAELVKDQGLNDPAADIARHFPYGGKIKRIHVNADQLRQLNAGELGVLQLDGRYLLVTAALLAQAEAIFAPAVALRVDPDAAPGEDPYADPQYQVPDDLVW
ncbi:DUF2058 family protein [Arenimonas sp. MALMAid1274]|uniref:DUF2058 domain-containing protein n=1 Tax=Arenimonas sp. MALMAid1274 TaxID=3411630 RepID=UPI003BA1CB8D